MWQELLTSISIKSIRAVAAAAKRLASGSKFGDTCDGAGQLGAADLLRRRIEGTYCPLRRHAECLGILCDSR